MVKEKQPDPRQQEAVKGKFKMTQFAPVQVAQSIEGKYIEGKTIGKRKRRSRNTR